MNTNINNLYNNIIPIIPDFIPKIFGLNYNIYFINNSEISNINIIYKNILTNVIIYGFNIIETYYITYIHIYIDLSSFNILKLRDYYDIIYTNKKNNKKMKYKNFIFYGIYKNICIFVHNIYELYYNNIPQVFNNKTSSELIKEIFIKYKFIKFIFNIIWNIVYCYNHFCIYYLMLNRYSK